MLTKRERAAGVYMRALAQSRSRVVGFSADEMVHVTAERLLNVRAAERVIIAARGTDRYSLREPDDARLAQMLTAVGKIAAQLEADSPRWATA